MKIIRCALLCCLFAASAAFADELPERKAGLWEVTTEMGGVPGGQVIKQCIDKETDKQMMRIGKSMQEKAGMKCSEVDVSKEGGSFITELECEAPGTRISSRTVMSGDFSSEYSGQTVTRFTPPLMGMSEQKASISARWLGPCTDGLKPGDTVTADGQKIEIGL